MQQRFRIVFEHHGDRMPALPVGISTVNPNGSDRIHLRETGSTPVWSPDGKWIAFNDVPQGYEFYATNIFIMRPDGRQVRQLTSHRDAAAYRPRWFSDSRTLAYSLWIDQQYQVFTTRIDSGKIRQINSAGSFAYPEWTPDGDIVALDRSDSPSNVVIMSNNGEHLRRCALFQAGDEEMAWSSDGRKITFVRCGSICFMNSAGMGLREFKPGGRGAISVAWLPDGSGVAFSADIRDNAGQELFMLDLSSSQVRPIVTNPCVSGGEPFNKHKYAAIIDVSCSPFLGSSRGGVILPP